MLQIFKDKTLVPLLILIFIALVSIIIVMSSYYSFVGRHYAGLSLLGITSIAYTINRKVYKYILLIILLLGSFGIIAFYYSIIKIGFGFFQIQLLPFLVLLVYFYVFDINKSVLFYASESDKQLESEKLTNHFVNKFDKLTDEEIDFKLSENLIKEAHDALKIIKNKRTKNNL